jgi:hypothetical protein
LSHSWTAVVLNLFQHIERSFTLRHWCRQTDKNTQCNGDTGKHPSESKFEHFLKKFLRLKIQLKVHRICPFEGFGLVTKIFWNLYILWTWGQGQMAVLPPTLDRPCAGQSILHKIHSTWVYSNTAKKWQHIPSCWPRGGRSTFERSPRHISGVDQ